MAFFFLGGFVHLHQLVPLESDVQAEGDQILYRSKHARFPCTPPAPLSLPAGT